MSETSREDETWVGRVVDGRYRVLERIGHGGMGNVYRVEHTEIGKVAAMKVLHGTLACDQELIDRFHREAEAISRLSHPNIVQVFDFGRLKDSVYLVMEYLKGEDLGTILRRDGPIAPGRGVPMLIQVCDAIAEAHANGIIHRDLKPENVRVWRTQDGHDFVKVLDFGLAKIIEEDKAAHITARGNLIGTPYYMAPEMIRGDALDCRCDIYSVGAMAYRMFTGENAFTAKTPVGVLTKHITEELQPPSARAPERNISIGLDVLVMQAMAKDPDRRFQSALEMKHALEQLADQLPGSARPDSPVPRRRESDRPEVYIAPPRDTDTAGRPALAREDLAFQWRLRGGRLAKLLVLLAVAGGIGFAIYWYAGRGEIYSETEEVEPNNGPEQATPIRRGKPLGGHLGRRVSATESDRDWYRLEVDGAGPQMLQARVSGISNMDITLELYDAAAGRVAGADSAARGGAEVLTNWTVDPGRYFLLVREVWVDGVTPTENVTDAYRIEASWHAHGKAWEMEPNDVQPKATPLAAGGSLRGYLGVVDDVDWVQVSSPPGTISGVVSGVAGADLGLEITSSAGKQHQIDEEGPSSGERFDKIAADGRRPVLIKISRKPREKAAPGTEPAGVDVPYTLKVWLSPAE